MALIHSLSSIRAIQWVGNHHSDSQSFRRVDRFVQDSSHSVADRAAALRIMARDGMGLTGDDAGDGVPDDVLVQRYLDSI